MNTKTARAFAEDLRACEAALMELYGALFEHWRECPSARCRRAKGCRREKTSCFRRWWRALSEEEREARRAPIRAAIEAAGVDGSAVPFARGHCNHRGL